MSILSLITGTLFRKPEERTAKGSGKFYVMATLKVAVGSENNFVRVFFFNEQDHAEILAARDGDAISVTGPLTVEVYDKGDGPRPSLSIVASRLLLLKKEKKPAKQREKSGVPSHSSSPSSAVAHDFGDDVPF